MTLLEPLLPTALVLAGAGILALGLKLTRREASASAALDREVAVHTIALCALPLILCAALILPVAVGAGAFDPAAAAAAGAVTAALYAFSLTRLLTAIRRRRDARLTREGRRAVARELEALADLGYRAVHDVALDGLRVDHVVVGPGGVFAVTTLIRRPPEGRRGRRVEERTVSYNGHALFFRRRTDARAVPAAEALAERLTERLRAELGLEVGVRAVIAVPGWHVQRTTAEGIAVVHPRQLASYFKYVVPRPLPPEACERVAALLAGAARGAPQGYESPQSRASASS